MILVALPAGAGTPTARGTEQPAGTAMIATPFGARVLGLGLAGIRQLAPQRKSPESGDSHSP